MPEPVHAVLDYRAGDGEEQQPPDKPLPAFLSQTRSDVQTKYQDLEWQQRERLVQGRQLEGTSEWAVCSGDDLAVRNRYANVEVYANNRIKLNVQEGQSDYINASPIKTPAASSGEQKYFIATQGPKEGIYGHIWRMVWQECRDTAVIVMLTQTHEGGREKCFQYFPLDMLDPVMQIDEDDEFADDFKATLTLQSMEEHMRTSSTIRELELKTEDGKTKKIWHFLFSGWPDFSVPEDENRDALIKLLHLSAEKNVDGQSPRIVHCSAGVGRSGTFIALDYLLDELEAGAFDHLAQDADPIVDIVENLRQQRMMMVQAEPQFQFLYDVLKKAWLARQQAATTSSGNSNSSSGVVNGTQQKKG